MLEVEQIAASTHDSRLSYGRSVDVAIDIGGTFTDVVTIDRTTNRICTRKILSTPQNFARGVIAGLHTALDSGEAASSAVAVVYHATTVATNAILERRGSVPMLITTAGFRDVLELATGRRPTLYDLMWEKPEPLVPRYWRLEVDHRITSRGELERDFDEAELDRLAELIRVSGVVSVAICLINSHLRPMEERRLADALMNRVPGVVYTTSVDLMPERGEFERTSTAVVNAYVGPTVARYLDDLTRELRALGIDAPLYVMQSNGGLLDSATARERSVQLIESGPAAGVMATRALVRRMGIDNAIAFDMGGTTAKASLIEHGEAFEAADYEVGAGMNASRGYSTGAGYYIRVPSLDIAEVGAGGGSIFWIDRGGSPRVGPRSAGADPGPACYGLGGTEPTLSDACVALGYLNPSAIAGGTQPIHPELGERALASVAERLELSVLEAAYGAIRIAIASMTTLVRAVTTQRGRDPRAYSLIAFGGAGPAYAVELARSLGIASIIVPASPGLWSAIGLLASDPQYDVVEHNPTGAIDAAAIHTTFARLEREMLARLSANGGGADEIEMERSLDLRYSGQKGTLRIAASEGRFGDDDLVDVLHRLDEAHARAYGHRKARESAELANIRLRASTVLPRSDAFATLAQTTSARKHQAPNKTRPAYFGSKLGRIATPVISRIDLDRTLRRGPMIIEEMDATTVVPPWASAHLDQLGNVVITVSEER